jgi:hypothetical protein
MIEATFDPREFIDRAGWKLSTTTADKPNWKHWYIVEAHFADDPDFRRFADLIQAEGYDARFEGIPVPLSRGGRVHLLGVPVPVDARAELEPTPRVRRGGAGRARAGHAPDLTAAETFRPLVGQRSRPLRLTEGARNLMARGMGGTGLEPVTPSLSSWCSPN